MAKEYVELHEFKKAANLLNEEVGKYLPHLMKRINFHHLTHLSQDTVDQVYFHIDQVMQLKQQDYMSLFQKINIRTLFLNGELDEYTTVNDIQAMNAHIPNCQFTMVPHAGHFLDLENKEAASYVKDTLLNFYLPS